MKKDKTIILLLTVFCLVGCGTNQNSSSSTEEGYEIENKYLVRGGLSDYYLVIPSSPLEKESLAAQEFSYFIQESSGCSLPIISDKEAKSTYKIISFGATKQFAATCPEIDLSSLQNKQSSYFITTRLNNIYIYSGTSYSGYGSLYGAYDLLHDMVGYTYYAEGEVALAGSNTVNLWNYHDVFVAPSFDLRTVSTYYTGTHETNTTRLRMLDNWHGKEWDPATYGHDHNTGHGQIAGFVAPTDLGDDGLTYGETHPDWFMSTSASAGSNQLCWTAGEELETLVAQKMFKFIMADPEAHYFMFAQQDNKMACSCDRCKKAIQEWGGTSSGLQIDFMNHVIDQVEALLAEADPGREVEYLVYAYYATLEPPVKKDDDGAYVPYSDRVIPNKKLRIVITPIDVNFSFSFDSPVNQAFYESLKGWKAVADQQIFMYLYDLNYTHYFANFNNFGTVKSMYQDCLDNGAVYLFTQGVSDTNVPGFDEMRSYVEMNLMWDMSLNYEDLAKDFMDHYYKDAASYLYDIYKMLRDQYAYYIAAVDPAAGSTTGDVYNTALFTLSLVSKMEKDILAALDAVAPLEASDPSLYETLKNRIMKEYLNVIFYKLYLYKDNYSDEEVLSMKKIWDTYTELFGITRDGEGGDLDEIFG